MIDVSPKYNSYRTARATGKLVAPANIIDRVRQNSVPKGDVLATARAAAISIAKRASEWMVFCHPIPLDWVDMFFEISDTHITVEVEVRSVWKTGVEMEALAGVNGALLNMYDMLKPLTDDLTLTGIRLAWKTGGKSDHAHRIPVNIQAAVVIVSDSTYAGTRKDSSGKAICEFLEQKNIPIQCVEVVPDEANQISQLLEKLASGKEPTLIITTGGTGIGPRDVTPEATRAVLQRELPGVSEAILSYGQNRVATAMLSRGVCGIRNQSIILNLPGSRKAVLDGMNAVFPGILHGFSMMAGEGHD